MSIPFKAATVVTSRRDALKIGGLTVSLAALVAACGEDRTGDDAPGRVGNAPQVTAPADLPVDDAVLLRTASSLEHTAVAVYETALGLDGAIPEALVPVVNRLVSNHKSTADVMAGLTSAAGGEPWTCPNPWLMDRLVGSVLEAIGSSVVGTVLADTSMVKVMGEELKISPVVTTSLGDITLEGDADGLSEGDELRFSRLDGDVSADVVTFATALENLAAAAHQELASAAGSSAARVAHIEAAALESRHAAVLALANGAEQGYDAAFSPLLLGEEEVTPDARGQVRQFAVGSTFGSTAQSEIKAGPGDVNNVRKNFLLQTPAANSLIYNEMSCDA